MSGTSRSSEDDFQINRLLSRVATDDVVRRMLVDAVVTEAARDARLEQGVIDSFRRRVRQATFAGLSLSLIGAIFLYFGGWALIEGAARKLIQESAQQQVAGAVRAVEAQTALALRATSEDVQSNIVRISQQIGRQNLLWEQALVEQVRRQHEELTRLVGEQIQIINQEVTRRNHEIASEYSRHATRFEASRQAIEAEGRRVREAQRELDDLRRETEERVATLIRQAEAINAFLGREDASAAFERLRQEFGRIQDVSLEVRLIFPDLASSNEYLSAFSRVGFTVLGSGDDEVRFPLRQQRRERSNVAAFTWSRDWHSLGNPETGESELIKRYVPTPYAESVLRGQLIDVLDEIQQVQFRTAYRRIPASNSDLPDDVLIRTLCGISIRLRVNGVTILSTMLLRTSLIVSDILPRDGSGPRVARQWSAPVVLRPSARAAYLAAIAQRDPDDPMVRTPICARSR